MKIYRILFFMLIAYLVFIVCISTRSLEGDELRYLSYAENVCNGFFSDGDNPSIRNGPGYVLFLTPFVCLGIPLIVAKLFNALFVIIGLLYFYRALVLLHVDARSALIATVLLGLYFPLLRWMIMLYSEPMSFMLICLINYYFILCFSEKRITHRPVVKGGLALGVLALTKIIFYHIALVLLVAAILMQVFKREKKYTNIIKILAVGIFLFSPFLMYTYSLTGKVSYTGTQGGEILYHRATPFDGEFGNWIPSSEILGEGPSSDLVMIDTLRQRHLQLYTEIQNLSHIEKDSVLKVKAKEWMQQHPIKYLENTVANILRLFFNYPKSYKLQELSTYGYMLPNAMLLCLFFLSLVVLFWGRGVVPTSFLPSIVLIGLYILAHFVLGGKGRHFIITVPIFAIFITYVLDRFVIIQRRQ